MSEPIKVGDLVVIAKPSTCCGRSNHVGRLFTVIGFGTPPATHCGGCFQNLTGPFTHLDAPYHNGWILTSRLKRIPPLDELGTTELSEVASDLRHKKVELDDSLERLQRIVEETSATHGENRG